jgi:hypothetical protein
MLMSLYTALVCLHVVVAILGTGQVAALALGGGIARRQKIAPAAAAAWLRPVLFGLRVSLGTMFVTGVLLNLVADRAHEVWWWFRASAMLLVVTFVLHARARAALRRLEVEPGDAALRRIERTGWSMCATVAIITVLMQAKPF